MENGILLIDKPSGWTSFDVVAKIRGQLRKKLQTNSEQPIVKDKIKVGHAGTLDPFATGLLVILVGKETKKQADYMKLDKEYEATLELGATSTTGDPEGIITLSDHIIPIFQCHSERPKGVEESLSTFSGHPGQDKGFPDPSTAPQDDKPTLAQIEVTLKKFIGEIEQTPPQYSAIKVNGQRAYKLARSGIKTDLKPRKIKVSEIELLDYKWPKLKIGVKCSSGTYIRTLAEDIGKALGCGAYLTELRRTKIGKFDIKDAKKIDVLINGLGKG